MEKKSNHSRKALATLLVSCSCFSLLGWPAIAAPTFPNNCSTLYVSLRNNLQDTSSVLNAFKQQYAQNLHLKEGANRNFMQKMEEDASNPNSKKLYLDVENSIQKKMNDSIIPDKKAVDAINNSFFEKFYSNLRQSPELMGRFGGEYKDYKSYRLRLSLQAGDDSTRYEALLADLYKKTNDEFVLELVERKITQIIPPRNDGLNDTRFWFLSGTGENSLQANMAARAARSSKEKLNAKGSSLSFFRDHAETLYGELHEIEKLRKGLSNNKALIEAKIVEKMSSGKAIPSKPMIAILRKIKPSEFETSEEYVLKIRNKGLELFGINLDDQTIINLTNYFKKVDSLSPPLFSTERVIIDLDKAKNGIVSIDFAGIGVDNIYQQMKSLTEVNLKNADPKIGLQASFQKMQNGVDQVSKEMDKAKDSFTQAVSKIEGHQKYSPQFSGDDGIYIPLLKTWEKKDKVGLIKELASSEDPSKFRVTFVSTHFSDGKTIPPAERSERIVRAETVEKDIRAKIVGVGKFTEEDARKFITAIDYAPKEKGGVFTLIIGGGHFSPKEIELIKHSFQSTLYKEKGESAGEIIFNNHRP